MVTLEALFRKPADIEESEQHSLAMHLPILKRYPEMRRTEIIRLAGVSLGEIPYYLMAEMLFDSDESMNAALASPEGRTVTRDLLAFAAPIVSVYSGSINPTE